MRILLAICTRSARAGTFLGLSLAMLAANCGGRDAGSPTAPSSPAPSSPPGPAVLHDSMTPPPAITATALKSMSFSRRPNVYSMSLDDFTSPTTGSVRSLRWLGVYCEALYQNLRLPNGGADSFYITFYSDLGSLVDVNSPPLSAGTYTVAQVNERFVQSTDYWCGNQSQPVPSAFYEYSLTLTQPVPVTAGTRYWVGIQALIGDSPSAVFGDAQCDRCVTWAWRAGSLTTNGYGLHTAFGNARIPFDFAWQVSQ